MGIAPNFSNILVGFVGLAVVLLVVVLITNDFLSVLPFINAQDSANLQSGSASISAAIPAFLIIVVIGLVGAIWRG